MKNKIVMKRVARLVVTNMIDQFYKGAPPDQRPSAELRQAMIDEGVKILMEELPKGAKRHSVEEIAERLNNAVEKIEGIE